MAMCCCIPLTRSPCQVLSATPGSCGRWRVENVSVQDAAAEPAKRVTLMYFERCAPELGATVVLRGGNEDELKGLKRLLASASYAAADLNAEAAYVYDFGGTMQPVTAALPAAPARLQRSARAAVDRVWRPVGSMRCTHTALRRRSRRCDAASMGWLLIGARRGFT